MSPTDTESPFSARNDVARSVLEVFKNHPDQGLSAPEVKGLMGPEKTRASVSRACNRLSMCGVLEKEDHPSDGRKNIYFSTDRLWDLEIPRAYPVNIYYTDGYPMIHHHVDGEKKTIPVHRLTAVAEYGFDAVKDKDIHHINKHPLDSRPSNLIPLDPDVHHAVDSMANLFMRHPDKIESIFELARSVRDEYTAAD